MISGILSVMQKTSVHTTRIMFRCNVPEYSWQSLERVWAIVGWHLTLTDEENDSRCPIVIIERMIEVPNSACYPSDTFRITKKDLSFAATLLRQDDEIIGFMHSHPPEHYEPSAEDIAGCGDDLIGAVLCENRTVWFNKKGVFPAYLITDY